MLAYQPYIAHNHRIITDLAQARVRGYRHHPFTRDWWRYADIARPRPSAARGTCTIRRMKQRVFVGDRSTAAQKELWCTLCAVNAPCRLPR